MPNSIDFDLTINQTIIPLRLFADGALFWPDGETLIMTDPHFGKADSFRHAGIPIPTSLIDHDLARLTLRLHITQAARLIVLGDFFHTRHSQSDNVLHALQRWRNHHNRLQVTLILGNHDAHAGPPPTAMDIQVHNAPFAMGPFVCHHMPQEAASSEGYILSGHLHPYVVLRDRDGTGLRLPAYVFGPYQAILPAFGGFTGGVTYSPSAQERIFVTAHGEIVEIPTSRQSIRSSH